MRGCPGDLFSSVNIFLASVLSGIRAMWPNKETCWTVKQFFIMICTCTAGRGEIGRGSENRSTARAATSRARTAAGSRATAETEST